MPWGELTRPTRDRSIPPRDGLVVVDKDKYVTSHDIVGAMRFVAGTRKVGHAGTLDPMATGVLSVGIGKATKLLQYVTGTSKRYTATVRLGVETSTEDAQGEVTARRGVEALGADAVAWSDLIEAAMVQLRGEILQVPSAVSALKVDGKRAYELVREGKAVELDARPVTIGAFRMLGEPRPAVATADVVGEVVAESGPIAADVAESQVDEAADLRVPTTGAAGNDAPALPAVAETHVIDIDVEVECSAGTYVRALARDLGDLLGTGAHLTALRRTRVGEWDEAQALSIAQLNEFNVRGEELPILGLTELCRGLFPLVEVTPEEAELLRRGQFIAKREYAAADGGAAATGSSAVTSTLVASGLAVEAESGVTAAKGPKNPEGKRVAAAMCEGSVVALVCPRSGMLKPDLLLS
ncbi:MAG: tRNA pseudouridine(55) synthase TruB [Ancrocorticia sp.]